MKGEDFIVAAVIAAGVFAFVVKRARAAAATMADPAYVPTGFQWDQQLGGYQKVGIDGVTYVHYA